MNKLKVIPFIKTVFLFLCLLSVNSAFADDFSFSVKKKFLGKASTPIGFDKVFVYVADGLFDITMPSTNPNLENCAGPFCDGEYFQKEIMGRSEAEIELRSLQAKSFFTERFGVDVDAPENESRLLFRLIQVDPRLNYHAIYASGDSVPSRGWTVRDGGWVAIVTDPNGFTLGGEFEGVHVPVGTLFIFGEYNIDATKKRRWKFGNGFSRSAKSREIVIAYQSVGPQRPDDRSFLCELSNEKYGEGIVKGFVELIDVGGGLVKTNVASVLSFPGLSDLPIRFE